MIPYFNVRLLVENQELRSSPDVLSSLHFDSSSEKEMLGIRVDTSTKDPYLPFVDGFPFRTDVGRSKKLAEVFTPRWVAEFLWVAQDPHLDKMFREFDYSNLELKDIAKTNFEPGIGTGNITCSMLWHRINQAWMLSASASEIRNIKFTVLMTYALSRFYGCDIDAGSLQVLKYRLLGGDIFSSKNVDFWTKQSLAYTSPVTSIRHDIRDKVSEELRIAQKNWYDPNWRGSLIRQYEYYTGEKVPEALLLAWHKVVNYNFFLSNLIFQQSDFDMKNLVPGIVAVTSLQEWGWLNIDDYSIALKPDKKYKV